MKNEDVFLLLGKLEKLQVVIATLPVQCQEGICDTFKRLANDCRTGSVWGLSMNRDEMHKMILERALMFDLLRIMMISDVQVSS